MMRCLILSVSLLVLLNPLCFAQSPELKQAIQVVRNWLNDPQAKVRFRRHRSFSFDLCGPRNSYDFEAPGYISIEVDLDTMRVVGWLKDYDPQPAPSQLSDEQLKNIALDYVRKHFPHFNEFEHWDVIFNKYRLRESPTEPWECAVSFGLYFINAQGQKIPCLPVGCGVNIDPYTGEIFGFGFSYLPITVKDLTPRFSEAEAKVRIEEAFRNLGAAQVVAVMSHPGFAGWPDGLVLGATQTSGLRLAYAFDYVVTAGKPGYEDEFGTEEWPRSFRAAIDAHTGELFYAEYWIGIGGEKERQILKSRGSRGGSAERVAFKGNRVVGVSVAIVLSIAMVVFLLRRFPSRVIRREGTDAP